MNDLASLLQIAHQAVDRARDLILTQAPGLVTVKGERDMATEVDFAVEKSLRAFLAEQTPDIAFVGEEGGEGLGSQGEQMWALDPVDGTANFIHGMPLCGVSLGLIREATAVLGVIDLPFLRCRYSAAQGGGAYANGESIQVRTATVELSEAIVAVGDYAVGNGDEVKNPRRLAITRHLAQRAQRVRMFGSAAVDLTWVASGRLDASITLSNAPWDTAAGVVIAREAGARVVDADGSEHTTGSGATIAASPALLDAVVDLVRTATAEAAPAGAFTQ